jgi:hypothetical protein
MKKITLVVLLLAVAARPAVGASSLHIGNSLTDTLDGYLQPIATSDGATLDFAKYTIWGSGTWTYHDRPAEGFGVPDVRAYVASTPLDHLAMEPFPNMPCSPTGYALEELAENRSDAVNLLEAWDDAAVLNDRVQLWIYETWPKQPPAFADCITGGTWLRDPAIWNPAAPVDWPDAEQNELLYMEAVRLALLAAHPERPAPWIIPGGRALARLKTAIEAGGVPGIDPGSFYATAFEDEIHMTSNARYFVSLVVYAVMFQRDVRGLPCADTTWTPEQAASLQQIAMDTVTDYPLSGFSRP